MKKGIKSLALVALVSTCSLLLLQFFLFNGKKLTNQNETVRTTHSAASSDGTSKNTNDGIPNNMATASVNTIDWSSGYTDREAGEKMFRLIFGDRMKLYQSPNGPVLIAGTTSSNETNSKTEGGKLNNTAAGEIMEGKVTPVSTPQWNDTKKEDTKDTKLSNQKKSAAVSKEPRNTNGGILINATASVSIIKPNSTKKEDNGKDIFGHFYMHIPKTGGYYFFYNLAELLSQSPQYQALAKQDRFRACNQGAQWEISLVGLPDNFTRQDQGVKCTMWMAETYYSNYPQHVYTAIRDPKAHVLSQYFHCTEAPFHKNRAHLMPPTIDEWLEAWVQALNDENNNENNKTKALKNRKYSCYDPRNHQSRYVRFQPPSNYTHYNNPSRKDYNDNHIINDPVYQDLLKKFTVLGDNEQMEKTVCLIAIRYAGWVPPACNCSINVETAPNILTNRSRINETTTTKNLKRHRHLFGKRKPSDYDHGVEHHGGTYDTTKRQDDLIDQLTKTDQLLYYHYTKRIFAHQIQQAEREYDVTICDTLRTS